MSCWLKARARLWFANETPDIHPGLRSLHRNQHRPRLAIFGRDSRTIDKHRCSPLHDQFCLRRIRIAPTLDEDVSGKGIGAGGEEVGDAGDEDILTLEFMWVSDPIGWGTIGRECPIKWRE